MPEIQQYRLKGITHIRGVDHPDQYRLDRTAPPKLPARQGRSIVSICKQTQAYSSLRRRPDEYWGRPLTSLTTS